LDTPSKQIFQVPIFELIMANKEYTEERSQQILLQSNCKRYLDVLVPLSLVKPVTEDPQIVITVDDKLL
jgi:hypothetical protein